MKKVMYKTDDGFQLRQISQAVFCTFESCNNCIFRRDEILIVLDSKRKTRHTFKKGLSLSVTMKRKYFLLIFAIKLK